MMVYVGYLWEAAAAGLIVWAAVATWRDYQRKDADHDRTDLHQQ